MAAAESATTFVPALAAFAEPVAEELRAVEQRLWELVPVDLPGPAPLVYRHLLEAGGKRLRPLLTLLSCAAAGGEAQAAVALATGVEVVHLASLIHDDVVDEATERRGRPTARERWGNRASILVGDLLIAHVFQQLSGAMAAGALGVVAGAVVGMCQAELSHDGAEHEPEDEPAYLANIRGKTAELMAASCQLGAIAARNPAAEAALREYGTAFGLAFQITDDLLDLYGDAVKLGKPVGQDLRGGQRTLPVIHALEVASAAQRRELEALLGRVAAGDASVAGEVARIVAALGGREYARRRATEYAARAAEAVEELAEGPARASLQGLPQLVIAREA